MKINYKFLPIKLHYFLFLGCVSPVYPFMVVVARQLGVPVIVQGTVGAVVLIFTVLVKPFVAAAADAFPRFRKLIFLLIINLMVLSYFSISFLPPMHGVQKNDISGEVVSISNSFLVPFNSTLESVQDKVYMVAKDQEPCYPDELWDCKASCDSELFSVSHIILMKKKESLNLNVNNSDESYNGRLYLLENIKDVPEQCGFHLKLKCEGGLYTGESCLSLWYNPLFYVYLVLLTLGFVTYATLNSISDAICLDLIGEGGDYGNHRAWGTVGWGLMGPISGFLVDWYSGDNFGKNYLPAFLLLLILGSSDIILSALKLKVPRIEKTSDDLWESVSVVVKKPSFVTFLIFVVLAGSFDGVIASYIFLLQEEMAKDTSYMRNMKFLQGMTIFVQCFFEAPFMWACGWILKRMKSSSLLSLVFFLYVIRFFILGLIGDYGPVWLTLVIETLNGPCYGLGYTVIVIHAGLLTPPGTSATVQSITNICYESLGYSMASLVGGIIYTVYGAPGVYYTFGVIAIITFFLHLVSLRFCESKIDELEDTPKAFVASNTKELVPLTEEGENGKLKI